MEKKQKVWIAIVFVLVLIAAMISDITSETLKSDGTIQREEVGGEEKSISLLLDAEGVLDKYVYELEIEPTRVTEEQAQQYFKEAIEDIEVAFAEIDDSVPMKETYVNGLVEAEWSFVPYGYISKDGTILQDEIPDEGVLITANVTLFCGNYEMLYSFSFHLGKRVLSEDERLLKSISEWTTQQMSLEGISDLQLPTELDGVKLVWTEQKQYLTLKILVLEIIAIICFVIGEKKKKEREQEERKRQLEEDYPDVVNQLVVLLGAGMPMRQAWEKIARQYQDKRKGQMLGKREAYEEIVLMSRRMQEGENERAVYADFSNRMKVMCFRRLMRLLLNNLEKGTKGLCELLDEECRQAYGQRILVAKTKGEEASTKMLIPLMIMMILVMAIVLMPAIISFSI